MADFNDMDDPELAAACNRLSAFCEALPADVEIDPATGLSEPDLVLILRRLHKTRHVAMIKTMSLQEAADKYGRASVPVTKGPWDAHAASDSTQEGPK